MKVPITVDSQDDRAPFLSRPGYTVCCTYHICSRVAAVVGAVVLQPMLLVFRGRLEQLEKHHADLSVQ